MPPSSEGLYHSHRQNARINLSAERGGTRNHRVHVRQSCEVALMSEKEYPRGRNGLLGYRKPEGTRKQRQLRAYDDEWALIQAFDKIIKYGDKQAAADFVRQAKSGK